MISACDTQDFVPFGREFVRRHPGQFQIQVQNTNHIDHGIPLLKSFREISLHDTSKKEVWAFYGAGGSQVGPKEDKAKKWRDEELYVSGTTVIWSRAGQDGVRAVIKTFTMDTPVLQALWATFILSGNENKKDMKTGSDNTDIIQKGICVLESSTLSFFMEEGGEYSTVLPFQVSRSWPIKNGLLFERALSPSELSAPKKNSPNQTTVFSLFHPLDDVCPVITRTSGAGSKVSYLTDSSQLILFTSQKPALAFTYDTVIGLHAAWHVRHARPDECGAVLANLDNTSLMHLTPVLGMNQSSGSYSRLLSNVSGPSSSLSPLRNLSERLFSPANLMRSSPVMQHHTNSRSQSPVMASEAALYRFHALSPQVRSANIYQRTPNSCNTSAFANESFLEGPSAPQPEVCLEHLWTEPAPPIREEEKRSLVWLRLSLMSSRKSRRLEDLSR